MELELKRKMMKVTIYGEKFDVRVPSVGEVTKYEERLKSLSGQDALDEMINYIGALGIPKEKIESLAHDDFITLIEFISNPKKK
jgi:hypothetical protein